MFVLMCEAGHYPTDLIAFKRSKLQVFTKMPKHVCTSGRHMRLMHLMTRVFETAASCKSDGHLSLDHSFHVANCVIARMQLTFYAFPTLLHLRKRRSALCAIPGSPTMRAHTNSPATVLRMSWPRSPLTASRPGGSRKMVSLAWAPNKTTLFLCSLLFSSTSNRKLQPP